MDMHMKLLEVNFIAREMDDTFHASADTLSSDQ